MFKPTITKEWLLATMELEGDGFANAGGIPSEILEDDAINDLAIPLQENERDALNVFIPSGYSIHSTRRFTAKGKEPIKQV